MTLQKILWPTDFSDQAKQALDHVKSLTQTYDAEIHVLYVIDNPVLHHPEWYGDFEPEHVEKMLAWLNKKARKQLGQICSDHLEGCPEEFRHIAVTWWSCPPAGPKPIFVSAASLKRSSKTPPCRS